MMKSRYIKLNGKELFIHYNQVFPDRPTLVFLPDSLGCVKLWRDFPQKFAEPAQCNLLVYDRLGYGGSEAMPTYHRENDYMEAEVEVLNDLLGELNITEAILFGHSDGGTLALLAAGLYPNRIKAVICEAAHIFVEEETLKGIYQVIKDYQNTDLAERLAKYHGDKTEAVFKAWTQTWTSKDFRPWNIEHFLPKITCPLLFIQGEKDEFGTLNQVEKTLSQVSGKTQKLIIPNLGHTPHKENPKLVIKKTLAFIDKCQQ